MGGEASERSDQGQRPGWMTGEELAERGWSQDDLGRVRTGDGRYVCGVSSRVRTHHLYVVPDPDPATGRCRRLWVDSDTLRAWGRDLVEDLAAEGVREVRRWAGGVLVRLAEGWAFRALLRIAGRMV